MRNRPASPAARPHLPYLPTLVLAAAALTAAFAHAPSVAAQTLRGTVAEQGSGVATRGALVMLLDSGGRHAASVVTNGAGEFVVQAPGAGTYTVRVERVGARAVTSPAVTLAADEERTLTLRVPAPDAVALAGIQAEAAPRCGPLPDDGTGDVARVWDEARKALVLTVRAASDGLAEYDFTTYHWETNLRRVIVAGRERERKIRGPGGRVPFLSRPARELARLGYVRAARNATEWFGPDAEVLLSDVFLQQHCFYLRRGEGAEAGWVGLAFEPVLARGIPDVRGTLWLEEATAALKRVEFTYTNIDVRDVPEEDSLPVAPVPSGEVHFARTEGGAWIVSHWELRGLMSERVIGSPRGGLSLHRPRRWAVVGGYVHGMPNPIRPLEPGRVQAAAAAEPPKPPSPPVEEIILPRA